MCIYWEKYKQTSSSLLFATVGLKFSSSNLSPTLILLPFLHLNWAFEQGANFIVAKLT